MLETKEQKQYFALIMVIVLILGGVTWFGRPDFNMEKKSPPRVESSVEEARKYLAYLDSLPIDRKASKELFQTIMTREEIETEVKDALQVDREIKMPQIDSKTFVADKSTGKTAVENYLQKTIAHTITYNQSSGDINENLFGANAVDLAAAKGKFETWKKQLQETPVPREAGNLHASALLLAAAYENLADLAVKYNSSSYSANADLWPGVYESYQIANQAALDYSGELNELTGKYKIAYIEIPNYADSGSNAPIPFVKTAHAFLGMTWNITIGDIPRLILDQVEQGLASALLKFMGSMIDKLLTKIQENYTIANFLYYSDALVAGQYTQDYLNKYVSNKVDRDIIKRFIPQLSCGANTADLRPVFEAKAKDYLGFDPENLNLNDPDYYQKLAKVGDFLATPQGWQTQFEAMADQAQSEAEKAARQEIESPGVKSARDLVKNGVDKTISNILAAQQAGFNSLMQLGVANAKSLISGFVAKLTENLINNFVFKGATGSGTGGGLAVLKEQATCVAAAQLQPVVALPATEYVEPAPAPTEQEIIRQQCQKYPESCNIDARGNVELNTGN